MCSQQSRATTGDLDVEEEARHQKHHDKWQKWARAARYKNEENSTRGRCAVRCAHSMMQKIPWPKFCGAPEEWPQFRHITQELLCNSR